MTGTSIQSRLTQSNNLPLLLLHPFHIIKFFNPAAFLVNTRKLQARKVALNILYFAKGPFLGRPGNLSARKAILETMIRLLGKATLLICVRCKERESNCQVSKLETCSYRRYKGIYVTRKVSGPGACFSKVPKLFGCILGDIILFV